MWKGALPRIQITITGENYDVSENLQTIASVLPFEQDLGRRTFLLDTIYTSKGIPVPPAPQQPVQPPQGQTKSSPAPTDGQIDGIAGGAPKEPALV